VSEGGCARGEETDHAPQSDASEVKNICDHNLPPSSIVGLGLFAVSGGFLVADEADALGERDEVVGPVEADHETSAAERVPRWEIFAVTTPGVEANGAWWN
jgi:hypothetical protein